MGLFNKAKDTDKMAKGRQDQSSQAMDQDQQDTDLFADDEYDAESQPGMQTAQERIGSQRSGQDQPMGRGSMQDEYEDQDPYRDTDAYQDQYEDQYQDEDQMQGQRHVGGQDSMRDQGMDPSDAQDDEQGW